MYVIFIFYLLLIIMMEKLLFYLNVSLTYLNRTLFSLNCVYTYSSVKNDIICMAFTTTDEHILYTYYKDLKGNIEFCCSKFTHVLKVKYFPII